MPIYEYLCRDCGAQLEKRQNINDAPLTVCEACGGKLEKQWSLSGFQFKGAGWYVTDYAGKNTGNGNSERSAEKKSSAESTSSADGASKTVKETTSPAAGKESKSSSS